MAQSPRARLSWRVLRARSERTSLHVDGVTLLSSTSQRLRVVVAATVTTHTTFATVSGFRQYTLTLAPADLGKLIGRQGRMAAALRTLAATAGEREGKDVTLEIRESRGA